MLGIGLPAGSELIVRLPRDNNPAIMVRAVVRFASPLADGLFLAGTEFVAELSPAQVEELIRTPQEEARRIQESILL